MYKNNYNRSGHRGTERVLSPFTFMALVVGVGLNSLSLGKAIDEHVAGSKAKKQIHNVQIHNN